MYFGNEVLQWTNGRKYLRIIFVTGLRLKCDVDYVTRKYYAANKCFFSFNAVGLSELLHIDLQQV